MGVVGAPAGPGGVVIGCICNASGAEALTVLVAVDAVVVCCDHTDELGGCHAYATVDGVSGCLGDTVKVTVRGVDVRTALMFSVCVEEVFGCGRYRGFEVRYL